MDNKKSAGVALLFIALFPLGIWLIYLTVSNPPGITWMDNLNDLLSKEHELTYWFYASIVSCVTSLLCAITYFSKASNTKSTLLLLLIICIAQASIAVWFLEWDLKIIYSLPVLLAYLAYKNPNKSVKQTV